eukprot:TRINITY_DN80178_c0_g1_i1.p1 TRINITY_DN80178_c0_g1~~TRINITY_DN80178_c0_g1_i1.p1  ORF type:complete len:736 (-),score=130.61 TRINITY_DN80178_c0_g1_i1:47-2191(-)
MSTKDCKDEPDTDQQDRALVCMWGELRAVLVTMTSLRTKVVEPLNADVAIIVQRQLGDDEVRLEALRTEFGSRLVYEEIYEKPVPSDFFGFSNFEEMSKVKGNWLNRGNSQVLINHKIMADRLESQGFLERYTVFMFTRSDFLHVIPFPPLKELAGSLGASDILTQAGHEFGGVNYNLAVARGGTLAKNYLKAPYDMIVARSLPNRKKTYNIELLWRVLFGLHSIRNLRMSITCYVTAESLDDRTTWRKIHRSSEHGGVLFKYESQMLEAYKNLRIWEKRPEWRVLRPPLGLQVEECHGLARRLFGLALAAVVPERITATKACSRDGETGSLENESGGDDANATIAGDGKKSTDAGDDKQNNSEMTCQKTKDNCKIRDFNENSNTFKLFSPPSRKDEELSSGLVDAGNDAEGGDNCDRGAGNGDGLDTNEDDIAQDFIESNRGVIRFHLVPRKGWDRHVRGMRCGATNMINWKGRNAAPEPPVAGCWLIPASDEAAGLVAQQQELLRALGWRVLSSSADLIRRLSNKRLLFDFAEENGLLEYLPQRYAMPEDAEFPCILKRAFGEYGKDCYIVQSIEEVRKTASSSLDSQWVLQELICGKVELATSLLVDCGKVLSVVSTSYQYASDAYVWPRVRLVQKTAHDVPQEHLDVFSKFLLEYRGICNFNYKVREDGALSIFEINPRVGGDLAVDAHRAKARALFEKLDEIFPYSQFG